MCGILGHITRTDERSLGRFRAALDRLAHRGPDDHGVYSEKVRDDLVVHLGHRRLSILDLSELGHQPMRSPRSGSHITFNGEVYNFLELRRELEAKGYSFRSNCDTEVILAAYDEWGAGCFARFNGMFAIGIYDPRTRQLLLGRDRLGIKPLYYVHQGDTFGFASELTALTALRAVDLELNPAALADYFALGYFPCDSTPLVNYAKLLPGRHLTYDIDRREIRIERFWDALDAYSAPGFSGSESEAVERSEQLLRKSVERRLIADVPLGAFLSGGIDSSLVVALMTQVSSQQVKTFTIGFTEPAMDEAPYAKAIAEHLGTEHHELYVSPKGLEETLVKTASMYDEPFADSSSIPTSILSQMTRQHVTVALSGDGGDELFAGYTRYRRAEVYRKFMVLPKPARRVLAAMLRIAPHFRPRGWAHVLESRDLADMYTRLVSSRFDDLVHSPSGRLVGDRTAREVLQRLGVRNWEKLPGATDLMSYLPEDLLTKVDRASMDVALEVRVPVLDHEFVEFAATLPHHMKYSAGTSKRVLRKILARHVPPHLWERPKRGFAIPLATWFRKELRPWLEDSLTSNWNWTFDVIDKDRARRIIASHLDGSGSYPAALWAFLSWKHWAQKVGLLN